MKQEGDKISERLLVIYGNNILSAQLLEVTLLGLGTMVLIERDSWSMVK